MIVDIAYVVALLRSAEIEPTAGNIEALAGMLSLEVFSPDQCLLDLKKFIEVDGVYDE
jgi:hypothetical protein